MLTALPSCILPASIKSSTEAAEALIASTDGLTVSPQVLLTMVTDPDSERTIEQFALGWHKMKLL
jgi:hypothetical protein